VCVERPTDSRRSRFENSTIRDLRVAAPPRPRGREAARPHRHPVPARSLRPARLLVHRQGTSALAHLRTGDPSQMEEAAPEGVHALSFASSAHKSFITDVSFAYTEGRQVPLRIRHEIQEWKEEEERKKRRLQALLGCLCVFASLVCVCVGGGGSNFFFVFHFIFFGGPDLVRVPSPMGFYRMLQHIYHTNGRRPFRCK